MKRQEKYPETRTFHFHNANPKNRITGDCVTRALCTALEIHTFNGWKARGFKVKKGEHSKIKFPIWKHTVKMLNTDTGNAENDKMNAAINEKGGQSNMFVKVSAFFTRDQVELATERAV